MIQSNSLYFLNKNKLKFGFKITTTYVSIINPFLFNHYSFSLYKKLCYEKPNEKIYVKQSYIILTWFYYLNLNLNKKQNLLSKNIKLVMIPKKIKKFTITQAPIAHKTNSKEQIETLFFSYKMFYSLYNYDYLSLYNFFNSLNEILLSILLTKNTISNSETNLLFLKKTKITLSFIDKFFFNYYFFNKKK